MPVKPGVLLPEHCKTPQRVTRPHDHVLRAVKLVRHWAVAHAAAKVGVPQRLARGRAYRDEVACPIAGEYQISGGAQYACAASGTLPLMAPNHFSSEVVNRFEAGLREAT